MLETNHSYIQWLFPNRYTSQFNKEANPLTLEEAKIFQTDPLIASNIVKNYEMLLDFYGMELLDSRTGQLGRSTSYLSRYNETFIKKPHNHLRIRRILTHLNNVGFRPYAINLVRHLEREIYGEKLFEHYISLPYLDRQIYIREVKNAPLKSLVGNKHCYQTWRIYGEFGIDKFQQNVLENNCFMTLDEMKQSIHFF